MNLRDFLGVGTKVKESIVKNNNQINFAVATGTWGLSTKWTTRVWPIIGLVSGWKNGGGPCLSGRCCSSGCVVLYRVNKDEGDESAFSSFSKIYCQYKFLKYSKEGILSSSHVTIRNIPSDICYHETKYC